ncbi:MAG: export transporter periplasmic protein LptC [Bacteroidota bacterium]|jgi:LPS export ABC transporter protein LptC
MRGILLFGFFAFFLSACENDMEQVQRISFDTNAPDETTKNLVLLYADSSYARVEIHAAIAETYRGKEELTKIKDSLRVNFFDATGNIVSTLSALYGEINYSKGELMVRDSVRLYNFTKKQTLETEALFWNQRDSSIFSKSSVIVRSPKGRIFGEGIKTKQDFSRYELIRPVGSWQLDKQQEIH